MRRRPYVGARRVLRREKDGQCSSVPTGIKVGDRPAPPKARALLSAPRACESAAAPPAAPRRRMDAPPRKALLASHSGGSWPAVEGQRRVRWVEQRAVEIEEDRFGLVGRDHDVSPYMPYALSTSNS